MVLGQFLPLQDETGALALSRATFPPSCSATESGHLALQVATALQKLLSAPRPFTHLNRAQNPRQLHHFCAHQLIMQN